jgi:hypothetical protein
MKFKKLTPVGFAARADPLTDSWRPILCRGGTGNRYPPPPRPLNLPQVLIGGSAPGRA